MHLVIPQENSSESDVLFAGALASQEANQDPIDLAFLAAARERHIFDSLTKVAPVSFAPFEYGAMSNIDRTCERYWPDMQGLPRV